MHAWLCRQTANRAKAWQKLNIKDSDHLSSFCYPVKSTLGFYIRPATCGNMMVTVFISAFSPDITCALMINEHAFGKDVNVLIPHLTEY